VLAKGADYKRSEIVGAEEVQADGGEVARIRLRPGRSTSRIVSLLDG
jgi:D-beta-D-heptose 7-phosphate kinase/D-beta-D-heptose 1-phosphate adenosyltransferase